MNTPAAPDQSRRNGPVARPLVKTVRRPSTVELIAVELRNAIYGGTLRPGASVREAEIAAQLGVSRGPLREAAQRLVQEGLLVTRPGAGLRVTMIARDQVEELYQARLAIEGYAVRLLSGLDDALRLERVGTVRGLLAALESAVDEGTDARRIGDADLDLHFGLVESTGNHRLVAYASTLVVQTRIAALSHPEGYVVRTDILDVHRSLLGQVADGDAEGAYQTLQDHFRQTVERLRGDLTEPFSTLTGEPDGSGYSFNPLG
jgi:DNA-binding GntR family transcriptional regulator